MFVMVPAFIIMFVFLRTIRLPIQALSVPADSKTWIPSYDPRKSFTETGASTATLRQDDWTNKEVTLQATLAIFLIAFVTFLGWVFFIMYAGIGLVALPMDNFIEFRRRPSLLKPIQYAREKKRIAERSDELAALAKKLKLDYRKLPVSERSRGKRDRKKTLQGLQQLTLILERDWDELQLCEQSRYMNPSCMNSFFPYFQLVGSIVGMVISLMWFLHIVLYMLPGAWGGKPITPFLNSYLAWFDSWFPAFGTITIAVFTFYLLLCVMRGNFKFGMRFTILPLHPMRYHKTLANSFLVNVGLIMLCTLPVVQFTADAFSSYARASDISTILNVQVKHLEWCAPLFKNQIFVIILLGFTVLTALYMCACGKERDETKLDGLKDAVKRLDDKYKKKGLKKKNVKQGERTFGKHKNYGNTRVK
jgi:LMBR1 domain-containing protein 1